MKKALAIPDLAPTYFVIFGATGDLAQKKLLPALFSLFLKGYMPKRFRIVAFSRRPWQDHDYRLFAEGVLHTVDAKMRTLFLSHVHYVRGNFDERSSYTVLQSTLERFDAELKICAHKLFYLAVPPVYYEGIIEELAISKLTVPCSDELGWTRVLIEKPFGSDEKTAEALDILLSKLFKEEQIFRIDHYLAKETVQNIMAFRFFNGLFEPLMNKEHVDRVHIELFEKEGIRERGALYDALGALRDVGQNHILQLLALVSMERPEEFSAKKIREERARVLEQLMPFSSETSAFIRAQYTEYKNEAHAPQSDTETYFRLVAHIQNARWHDVPFILESGKGLKESRAAIRIIFKKPQQSKSDPDVISNELIFRIQPEEGINIQCGVKKPGFTFELVPKTLSFSYATEKTVQLPEAYERLLFDCMQGDQTLFPSTREIKAQWRYIAPVIQQKKDTTLLLYEKGTHPTMSGKP
jgi:glucose-6-phosphate 1-dehydrogenase